MLSGIFYLLFKQQLYGTARRNTVSYESIRLPNKLVLLDIRSISSGFRISQTGWGGGRQLLSLGQKPIIWQYSSENCMKMTENGRVDGLIPGTPLDRQ